MGVAETDCEDEAEGKMSEDAVVGNGREKAKRVSTEAIARDGQME